MKIRRLLFTTALMLVFGFGIQADARTYRVIAVRVDFPYEDPDHDTTSGRGAFDLRDYYDESQVEVRAAYDNPWDVPPHNRRYFENHLTALNNYWKTVSEGQIDLAFDIWPKTPDGAYTLSKKFYKYGNGRTKEETYKKLVELLHEALSACKTEEGDAVDFNRYDTFMIIHAGIGSETSGQLNDIPSAFISTDDITEYLDSPLVFDGKRIDNGLIVPEMTAGNGYGGLNGIMAQMFGHRLGLPSMSNNEDGLPGAGGWSLMDTGAMSFGYTTRGFVPTHPCAWSKIELGLIEPFVVTQDTTLEVAATHISNGLPRAIKIPITADEYLLIENRYRAASRDSMPEVVFSDTDSSGVWLSVDHQDAYIPGSGLLVWRINDAIIRKKRADGEINDDIYRRGIDIIEADGREDIGAFVTFGDDRGEFTEGHDFDALRADHTKEIDPFTRANTSSMWGANSGITLSTDSDPGETMRLTIRFEGGMPGFPVDIESDGRLAALDFNGDGIDELIVSDESSWNFITSQGKLLGNEPGQFPALVDHGSGIQYLYFVNTDGTGPTHMANNGTYGPAAFYDFGTDTSCFSGDVIGTIDADGIGRAVLPFYGRVSGERVPTTLFLVSDPTASTTISLPDTAHVVSMASTGDIIAALGDNNKLYMGNLTDETLASYPLGEGTIHAPVIADFDRDNEYETAVVTDWHLYMYETDGSRSITVLGYEPTGDPAVADINFDGYPELVLCSGKEIFAYGLDGAQVNGFPFRIPPGDESEAIATSPVIADLDGDRDPDIVVVTSSQRMLAYDTYGNITRRFPIATRGKVTSPPCVFKYDDAGTLAIAYATVDGTIMAHDLNSLTDDTLLPWTMWKGSPGLSSAKPNSELSKNIRTTAPFEAYCYPNPITGSTGTFRVTPAGPTGINVTVFTADGAKVFEKSLAPAYVIPGIPNELSLDASELASGLYIAKIATKQKTVFYKFGVLK